ncbi:MAG: type II toxin-antitoxin system VapC family toxin [Akkermansiaceae bacterium]
MLIDTDVIVWCLRGNSQATATIANLEMKIISQITRMELIVGCRTKSEIILLKRFLNDGGFQIIPLSPEIGMRADLWLEQKNLSHGVGLADCLIAATASNIGQPLLTANAKHFRCFSELQVKKFTP